MSWLLCQAPSHLGTVAAGMATLARKRVGSYLCWFQGEVEYN